MPKKIRLDTNIFPFMTNNILSYLIVTLCNFFWVSGFIFANQHNMSFVESQMSRYIMQALVCYCISKYMGYNIQFKSALEFKVLFTRSIIFTIHAFVLGWSQFYLPLYIVHTISAFGPIFVCILNYFIYGKSINKHQIIGILIAFCGILLTVNGRSIYQHLNPDFTFNTHFKHYKSDDPLVRLTVSLIFLICVIFWAYGILITKKNQHHIVEVVYHQAIFGLIGSSIGYQFLETKTADHTFYLSILWTGTVLGGGFTLFNIGLSLSENTGVCSMITQTTVIISYCYSVFRYGEFLNIICVIGGVLLISGVSMVLFMKT